MKIRKIAAISVLVLSSFAASNVAPSKAELESMYDKAFREFNAANYPQALKELDAIDARQPDLAESQNLRGVILMRQAEYDQAEAAPDGDRSAATPPGTTRSIIRRWPKHSSARASTLSLSAPK